MTDIDNAIRAYLVAIEIEGKSPRTVASYCPPRCIVPPRIGPPHRAPVATPRSGCGRATRFPLRTDAVPTILGNLHPCKEGLIDNRLVEPLRHDFPVIADVANPEPIPEHPTHGLRLELRRPRFDRGASLGR
jgi:hypothetical protein